MRIYTYTIYLFECEFAFTEVGNLELTIPIEIFEHITLFNNIYILFKH